MDAHIAISSPWTALLYAQAAFSLARHAALARRWHPTVAVGAALRKVRLWCVCRRLR